MTDPVNIEALLHENRVLEASAEFKAHAVVADSAVYELAERDPEAFWESFARELEWSAPWSRVLDWKPPFAKWFVGGKINASVNCLDRHVRTARRNKAAIVWEGEPGDTRTLTYRELHREVNRFASVLRGLGVTRGDRVAIYMPLVPEVVVAMLACARIGAVHTVVFGGFAAESLRDRINDAEAKVVITQDGAWRRGAVVPLKDTVDAAVAGTPSVEKVVVLRRLGETHAKITMKPGRDVEWTRSRSRRRSKDDGMARVDGRRGSALHPLHVGHDREAQGHRAHHRRATWSARTPRRSGSSTSRTTTSTGARPTSAGSRATATSSTARSRTARPS